MTPSDSSPASFTIVSATPAHVDAVAPLFDAYRQFYQQPPDLAAAQAFIAARLAHGDSTIFLAQTIEAGAAPAAVGFTQLYPIFSSIAMRPAWLLNDLYVAPAWRAHGVGAALLTHARAFAQASGAAEMMLQTAVTNAVAQRLYTRLGWVRDDEYLTFNLTL